MKYGARRMVGAVVLAALGGAAPQTTAGQGTRPNVVLVVVDDLNVSLGCYGNRVVQTPNVDRLAQRGVVFQHAYCQYPVCNPSRTSLFTGLAPERTGVMNNGRHYLPGPSEAPLLPRYFRDSGYRTLRVGKIFHDSKWMLDGKSMRTTDDPAAWDVSEDELLSDDGDEDGETRGRQPSAKPAVQFAKLDMADEATGDGIVARRASRLLEQNAGSEKPFFLAIGFRKPHLPYEAPTRYFEQYNPDQIGVPRESPEHLKSLLPVAVNRYFDPTQNEANTRQAVLAHYACVSFMDAQVGLVLDTLERLKLRENTVVVFVSDNGSHQGEHALWGKNTLFEESVRVPLIIACHKPGGVSRRVVEYLDVYPTLVELCGLPTPPGLQGKSLLPLLNDPQAAWDKPAYTILKRDDIIGRSLRTERFRYTEWDEGRSGVELYDHDNDPRELRNLCDEPAYARDKGELRRLLHLRTQATGGGKGSPLAEVTRLARRVKRSRLRWLWGAGVLAAGVLAGLLLLAWRRRKLAVVDIHGDTSRLP